MASTGRATGTSNKLIGIHGLTIERVIGTSDAATAKTTSTILGSVRRLLYVTVNYSAVTTGTVTVIITLNSGGHTDFDNVLETISTTVGLDNNNWYPTTDIYILANDTIDCLAASAGGSITSHVAIYTQMF